MFETIFQMRYYTQKYRFTSKTAKWNQKRNILFSSVKKTLFFLRKLTKMSKLMLCFSETPKTFTCIRLRQVTFFISGLKKVVRLKQCPLYGFHFRAWPIYAGFTVDCHMIICEYSSLSHKPDYQGSWLNTYQFVSLFQWFT